MKTRFKETSLDNPRDYLLIEDPVVRRKEQKKWCQRESRRLSPEKSRKEARDRYRIKHGAVPREEWTREKQLLRSARENAKTKNREFNLDLSDILIPDVCPVLGVRLDRSAKRTYNSPSIDRIDSNKGYVKGNVEIISWRANLIKSNMTLDECEKLLAHLRKINVKEV